MAAIQEGRAPQEILEQKRKNVSSVINGHLACPERMWEEGGKKQQVCWEGKVCLQMCFKLLESEAVILLPSGEEGFEAFISLPQIGGGGVRGEETLSFSRSSSSFKVTLSPSN